MAAPEDHPRQSSGGLSRRELLVGGAAALLAGLWPGRGRAAGAAAGEDFEFFAANDLHFTDPRKCPPWFERAFAAMRASAPRAEFLLVSGDLTSDASEAQLRGMRAAFARLELPVKVMPGNHDVAANGSTAHFERHFPGCVNYAFEQRGWQFFCLNSVASRAFENTRIPAATFTWLDENLARFDPGKPTVIATHFPLGPRIVRRPRNADELLARFARFNLQAILNGHWHGFTEARVRAATATTNRCCSRARGNHDGSPLKGWFVCAARGGTITRRFVAVPEELMRRT
jgi:hypothetical protein